MEPLLRRQVVGHGFGLEPFVLGLLLRRPADRCAIRTTRVDLQLLEQLVGAFGGRHFCDMVCARFGVLLELHEARADVVVVEVRAALGVGVLGAWVVLEVDALVVVEVLIFAFGVFFV